MLTASMFYFLFSLHSLVRWFVIVSLIFSLFTAYRGLVMKSVFTPLANRLRHWTATIAHIQLMIGVTIYFQSPVVKSAVKHDGGGMIDEPFFFRYLHISMMFVAIVLITIGSAKAKRMNTDREKYRTMANWFTTAVLIILLAIPWPFYDFVSRPLIRGF